MAPDDDGLPMVFLGMLHRFVADEDLRYLGAVSGPLARERCRVRRDRILMAMIRKKAWVDMLLFTLENRDRLVLTC